MHGARAVAFEGLEMGRRPITHVAIEAVGGIALGEDVHLRVAMDLRDDRRGGDARVLRVPLHDRRLRQVEAGHLARIDEHAPNRPQVKVDPDGALNARPVVPNQSYHFKVERTDGKTIRWFVDDIEIISFTDPEPMKGTGHQHMGFNDWAVPVCFDNLQITPLGGS